MQAVDFLKSKIRDIENYPIKGVLFKDVTTLLKNSEALNMAADLLYARYKDAGITKVVGIESRGFILGSILAYKLNAGFVPIRKKDKLPHVKISKSYMLEYGMDAIEMHVDGINADDIVLLHDDLLATGGTTIAAVDLLKGAGARKIDICFLLELSELKGRKKIPEQYEVFSVLQY